MTRKSVSILLISLVLIAGAILLWWNSTRVDTRSIHDFVEVPDHYLENIKPIFDGKCIACHSCYNSPCQLNLTSLEGVLRGANKTNIYDFPKFEARKPTRLGVDAHGFEQWKELGFYPVVGEGKSNLLSYMIGQAPGIESGLQKKYDSEYSRACMSSIDGSEIEKFVEANPAGRMPLGFPELEQSEKDRLIKWSLNQPEKTAPIDYDKLLLENKDISSKIDKYEDFFNRSDLKNQIVSRYLYEHLFLADLYFEEFPNLFFKLVRSKSRKGPIEVIATPLPFDQVAGNFHYRLKVYEQTIVHKTHLPFKFTEDTLSQWEEWFLKAPWADKVAAMPPFGKEGANPFQTFKAMPRLGRYQFFLTNSHYFINSFIKGPVCRGQTALNVINDHFWVMFLNPDVDPLVQSAKLYEQISKTTEFPSEIGDDFDPFIDFKDKYWRTVELKFNFLKKQKPLEISSVWNGDKKDPNAAITVYRHFDSANVLHGFQGRTPKTVWVLDYHIFESIYYNLTAGYNVFGPLLHQLNSRLYMEVSRVASEDLFLSFLPDKDRNLYRQEWNIPTPPAKESTLQKIADLFSDDAQEKFKLTYPFQGNDLKSEISLKTKDTKTELIELISTRHMSDDQIHKEHVPSSLQRLSRLSSEVTRHLPDTILLSVGSLESQQTYTLIHNKDHYNVEMILFEDERRRPEKDTLDVVAGLATSYVNLIVQTKQESLEAFVDDLEASTSAPQVWKTLKKYGLSRGNPDFWKSYNQISDQNVNPLTNERGKLDLNRYLNL